MLLHKAVLSLWTRKLITENIFSKQNLPSLTYLQTCGDSYSAFGMSLETVCHLWHRDYTCHLCDSRVSGSLEEKTPVRPEIECRIRSLELFVFRPLTSRLLIKADDSVKTGLPSNVVSTQRIFMPQNQLELLTKNNTVMASKFVV